MFSGRFDDAFAERELSMSRFAYDNNVPTPRPGDVLRWEGRPAVRFEYVSGPTLDEQLRRRFWNFARYMRLFAETHARIHAVETAQMARKFGQKDWLGSLIEESKRLGSLRQKALDVLHELPAGNSLCHGDYSTGNTILRDGRLLVIDWGMASIGDPAADVANTWLGMGELVPRSNMHPALRWGAFTAIRRYRDNYISLTNDGFAERIDNWLFPVAAARLGAQEMAGVRQAFLQTLTDFIHARWGN